MLEIKTVESFATTDNEILMKSAMMLSKLCFEQGFLFQLTTSE